MKLCQFVVARNVPAEAARFRRHVPFYMSHYTVYDGYLMICSQVGNELFHDGFETIVIGGGEYIGTQAIDRWTKQFSAVFKHHPDADWYWYQEADSLSLKPTIPDDILSKEGIHGPRIENADPKFLAPYYFNVPLLISHNTMERLCRSFGKLPLDAEYGSFDRWVSRLMIQENLPHYPFGKYGFTEGPIADNRADVLRKAIAGGAQFIHGVKTIPILDVCKGK